MNIKIPAKVSFVTKEISPGQTKQKLFQQTLFLSPGQSDSNNLSYFHIQTATRRLFLTNPLSPSGNRIASCPIRRLRSSHRLQLLIRGWSLPFLWKQGP